MVALGGFSHQFAHKSIILEFLIGRPETRDCRIRRKRQSCRCVGATFSKIVHITRPCPVRDIYNNFPVGKHRDSSDSVCLKVDFFEVDFPEVEIVVGAVIIHAVGQITETDHWVVSLAVMLPFASRSTAMPWTICNELTMC